VLRASRAACFAGRCTQFVSPVTPVKCCAPATEWCAPASIRWYASAPFLDGTRPLHLRIPNASAANSEVTAVQQSWAPPSCAPDGCARRSRKLRARASSDSCPCLLRRGLTSTAGVRVRRRVPDSSPSDFSRSVQRRVARASSGQLMPQPAPPVALLLASGRRVCTGRSRCGGAPCRG
jgi:hypothetical protein